MSFVNLYETLQIKSFSYFVLCMYFLFFMNDLIFLANVIVIFVFV